MSRSFGPGVGVGRSSTATSLRPMNTAAGMTAGTSVIAMTKGSPKPDTGVNLSQLTPSHGASEHRYGAQCPQLMGAGATDAGGRSRGESGMLGGAALPP